MSMLLQSALAVAVLAQSAVPVPFLDSGSGMQTLPVPLSVCAASKCLVHEDSDCDDRLVSDDDRPSSPASTIGDEADMHIADLASFSHVSPDNERKPKPLRAAEIPLGSPADDALEPTASAHDTNPAAAGQSDGATDALDRAICASLHASGCPLVIIDQSSGEIAPYKPAGSGAYRLMYQSFQKHWPGVQQAWDTAQAFKARAADSLQQALSWRYDATQIGCGLVQQYIAETVWQLELQAVSDLQAAGQWEVEWQVRVQAMQQAVRVAEAVAKNGRLEHVLVVPVFVV